MIRRILRASLTNRAKKDMRLHSKRVLVFPFFKRNRNTRLVDRRKNEDHMIRLRELDSTLPMML
ncbi:hypothetical protein EKPV-NSW-ORF021 [Eastern grey kangaroopox virus]|uniref:Uncharacterized protein n=1 Tax=Eastern grey kangaroopox virus TaxID=2042482 RepID=A0A345Z0N6_9POXV|nr:hypothetical protein EKPV-NSW-ORF021 [Eastern grey kangaroopox virus]